MSKKDLMHIVDKSLDLFIDKEWKTDLMVYIYVAVVTIGISLLILMPVKALLN